MGIRDLFTRKKKPKKVKKPKVKKSVKAPKVKKKAAIKVTKKKPAVKKRSPKPKVSEKPVEINRNECPECGSSNVVISKMTGNTICQDCGAIFAGLTPDVAKKFEEVKKQG